MKMRAVSVALGASALFSADAFMTTPAALRPTLRAATRPVSFNGRVRSMPRAANLRMQEQGGKGVENEEENSGIRQLLGVKGGKQSTNKWAIRLQLTKPVTWVPLIWGVLCGAAAAGNYHSIWDGASFSEWSTDFSKAIVCMILSGPLLTGFTQTINDWYDRDIDAINEPNRPIPSGAISENEVITQIFVLLFGGLGVAYGLDVWAEHEWPVILTLAVFGSFISYIYSAPPLKLKQSWKGNYALGASYIALPWWCGQCLFNVDSFNPTVAVLTIFYSWAGLGIAIVNDFKSIEGDREMGLISLPVQFGIEKAKWICVASIDLTQIAVAGYLAYLGETTYAAVLTALILPQMYLQTQTILIDPVKNDVAYQAKAQPFLVFGILTTALACGHHTF